MNLYETVKTLVPPLRLSRQDAIELRELGDQFVHETLQQYLEFRGERRGQVDRSRWKEIRHKDDIRVYTERKSSALKMARIKGHLGEARGSNASEGSSLPPFLVVGTVVGDLDDVMFGTTTPTVDDMKIKTAYVDDGLVESKVLQQLIRPTPDDPFRTLSVKWVVVHPPKVQSLIRARDYTYIDSTGIVISPSGERIGFRITHSIAFPNFPNFEQEFTMVRGNTSICCLYRQCAPNVVDCFVTGFFELHGDVMKGLALLAIAGQGLSFSKQVHCAQMKKLAWRLSNQQKLSHARQPTSVLGDGNALTDCCKVCSRTFVSSRTSRFLLGPITKKCCSLCFELVCSKCRVKKRLYFVGHGHKLIYHDLSFCSPCVTETVRMDAYEIAKDEFARRGSHYNPHSASHATWSRSSQSSSGSGRHHPMLATTLSSTRSEAELQVWDE